MNSSSREKAAGKRYLHGNETRTPFEAQRIVMFDPGRREALVDMGRAGTGWVNFDDFGMASPVWRTLPDDEFMRFVRNLKAAGPR
jgi:hypothetical protein